jgi:hypothetical protein
MFAEPSNGSRHLHSKMNSSKESVQIHRLLACFLPPLLSVSEPKLLNPPQANRDVSGSHSPALLPRLSPWSKADVSALLGSKVSVALDSRPCGGGVYTA